MRTNNVYHERDMQLAADLQGEYLTDAARLETSKTLLVFRIAGLAEPATMAELQLVKVTFEKYLQEQLSQKKKYVYIYLYSISNHTHTHTHTIYIYIYACMYVYIGDI